MRLRFKRQDSANSCDAGKLFYRCSIGAYAGCCSTNPCDTGICGDDSDGDRTTATSSSPSTTDSTPSLTATASKSSVATPPTSTITRTGSLEPPSTSSTIPPTSTSTSAPSSSTLQPSNGSQAPIGAIVGGVLGGLAALALLAALLWFCLQRQSKLRIKIRLDKKIDETREKELLEAEAAILEREKFLDAAKHRAEPEAQSGDPFAEYGGFNRDNNNTATSRPADYRHQQPTRPLDSVSMVTPSQGPPPTIITTPAHPSTSLAMQQNSMPLSSISEKENTESIPILDGNEIILSELAVDTNQAALDQQAPAHNGMVSTQTVLHTDRLATSRGRQVTSSARILRAHSTDFSSISSTSNTNSYANTASPVSPTQLKDSGAPDGVVMRSNLNGSWNRRARQGSMRKHVMSFMEYDTENDSLSSSRRSSLRVPVKAFQAGDQGR
ncbi:hypothetical protein EPUS_00870 [Endocarpon pusillum Z07020]|uniref:Uncharacterized protein n=1 Tax=Endocarpon pusillum (strain Z07020 / HMAS-L-300199) TaxID=1263415 RepID=U1G862_ENDPU|nr:uncharacterized protein EPUS_00870 [Endocarpon pusillum Z07020]ERF73617.1 hypothetical protein EPUS_00870 [Endocarpon pusillum Z07020]